jgi:hypothetical protein
LVCLRYRRWQERIPNLLGVTPEQLWKGQGPERLLLGPAGGGLSETDIRDLFDAVREHLLGGLPDFRSAVTVKHGLRALNNESLLPVLLAMSLVARLHGRHHVYWPWFTKRLIGPDTHENRELSYDIASELSACWLRLYRHTGLKLYYPREGKTNIKWPIGHAGLVAADEEMIKAFGLELAHEVPEGEPHPLATVDVDEFHQALTLWLLENHPSSLLLKTLDNPDTGLLVAELAQSWLLRKWETLVATGERPETAGPSYLRPSASVALDPSSRQIGVVLREAAWPGFVASLFAEHGGSRIAWSVTYFPAENCTRTGPLFIPLRESQWEPEVQVLKDGQPLKVPLVRSPFGTDRAALLFGRDGLRTRQWRPAESYYLVLPPGDSLPPWAEELFDRLVLQDSMPQGWASYRLLYAEGSTAVLSGDLDEQMATLSRLGDELLSAGAAFRLPDPSDLAGPTLRPILSFEQTVSGIPTFIHRSCLHFRIAGGRERPEEVRLERRGADMRLARVGSVHLAPGKDPVVLQLDRFETVPGYYRLTCGESRYDFRIVDRPSFSGGALSVGLVFLGPDGVVAASKYHGLNVGSAGSLRVNAWPGAEVCVTVGVLGAGHDVQVQTGSDGRASFEVSRILPPLSTAEVSVSARYGPLVSQEHVFADCPYVGDWELRRQGDLAVFSGNAQAIGDNTKLRTWLLPERPWENAIRSADGGVSRGQCSSRIDLAPGEWERVRYVLVGAAERSVKPESPPWLAALVNTVPSQVEVVARGDRNCWEAWTPLAEWIAEHGTRVPELTRIALATRVLVFAERVLGASGDDTGASMGGVRWANLPLLECLPELLHTARPLRAALVPGTASIPFSAEHETRVPMPGVEVSAEQVAVLLSSTALSEPLRISVCEGQESAEAAVVRESEPGRFHLTALETQVYCVSCGRLLPFAKMNNHRQGPFSRGSPCGRYVQYSSGRVVPMRMVVHCTPEALIESLVHVVSRALADGRPPSPVWLAERLTSIGRSFRQTAFHAHPIAWFRALGELAVGMLKAARRREVSVKDHDLLATTATIVDYPEALEELVGLLALLGVVGHKGD